jgi:charged multivesicular body protein 2A
MGQKLTLKEQMRNNERALKKAIRGVEREKAQLERDQKKLINDIKKNAKQGQMGAVKVMAKDLVRNKRFVQKIIEMRSHLWGVQQRMHEMRSTHAMTGAMRGASKAMTRMNQQMNLPQIQKVMKEFAMESEKMEMTSEMVGDSIDDAMGAEEDEEESEEVVSQVLAEIGLDMSENLGHAPVGGIAQPQGDTVQEDNKTAELEARLDNLRR